MTGLLLRWFVLPVVIFALGFGTAWKVAAWRNGASQTKAAQHVARVTEKQGAVNQSVAVAQQAAQDRIVYRTRTLIKEIPGVITPQIDRDFSLPVGLVRVHDAAAGGLDLSEVPLRAGESDGDASGIAASAAGIVIAENYGSCLVARSELTGWQDWYREQAATFNGKDKP